MSNAADWFYRSLVRVVGKWPLLNDTINKVVINNLVNVCRHRPHPWSTVSDYVSWTSLTDLRWSARHLPATNLTHVPDSVALTEMFRRPPGESRLCPKSTCLFPTFAQYLTDGFIRTRMPGKDDPPEVRRQTTSNHHIDLCPLYGRTPEQTATLRLLSQTRDEKGRLKSHIVGGEEYAPFLCHDDGRIKSEFAVLDEPLGLADLTSPDFSPRDLELRRKLFAFGGDRTNGAPQVAAMNTLLLREHNRLAGLIETAHPTWDDERVFQTARNSTIAVFIKIVVEEYINHISPTPFPMRADPRVAWDAPWNKPNWMTTEFSLLYRWHSLIPDAMVWNDTAYSVGELILNNAPLLEVGLGRAFIELSSQHAGRLGAFNTADALLALEQNAIDQGRLVHLAPYADYRAYIQLKRPQDFSDISTDAGVVELLRKHYPTAGDVEFYVGLFAEDVGANSPLPPLLMRMVAVDAFSQALTNPLFSKSVFNRETFSAVGWEAIQNTSVLADIVARNCPTPLDIAQIGMTVKGWKYSWK